MSYIDTFDHEFVGYFAGLPLYHPTVEVDPGLDEMDFGCGPNSLVLGGGSGEHRAIVFRRLDVLAANFLEFSLPDEPDTKFDASFLKRSHKVFCDVRESFHRGSDVADHAGWRIEDYHAFFERCQSEALVTPLGDPELPSDAFGWLCCSIGECVYFLFPSLVASLLEKLSPIQAQIDRPWINNVLSVTRGHPDGYGRQFASGSTSFGASIFDENGRSKYL